MKRIFVSLSTIMAFGLTTFAQEGTVVNDKVKESFQKEFAGAQSVKWNDTGDYQMATFVWSGSLVQAFFNTGGELEGYARNVLSEQLPLSVTIALDKRFHDAFVSDILEIINPEGVFYRFTIETTSQKFHVKTNTEGKILQMIKIKNGK